MSTNFLAHAAALAASIDPHVVAPNPRVGCVVVRDGEIISKGAHEHFGDGHAEALALQDITESGLDIYVTLEPCDHFTGKKTPSCTELLISKKPKKVVIGQLDPRFQGKNVEKLRAAGIEVEVRDCQQCEDLNPFFSHWLEFQKPYVTLKLAQSLDGKITSDVQHISNDTSRLKVHEMRAQYSAILMTTETIVDDDPRLNCRLSVIPAKAGIFSGDMVDEDCAISNPQLIIIGDQSRIPENSKIFSIPDREIHFFDTHNLQKVIEECGKLGIDSLLCECGATVSTALLASDLVDELQLFIAPRIFGKGLSGFREEIDLGKFELAEMQDVDGDSWVRFKRK